MTRHHDHCHHDVKERMMIRNKKIRFYICFQSYMQIKNSAVMSKFLQILLFFLFCHLTVSKQPNFPAQIIFSEVDGQILYAIDEINQRAAMFDPAERGFVFKHIPYAIPDSPQSKYYTQLTTNRQHFSCIYETYWEHGASSYSLFPSHWQNGTTYEIKSYIKFSNQMIYSTNSSDTEDYWYANATCQTTDQHTYPCEEIYFKKNTDIPVRYTQVRLRGWEIVQIIDEYNVISVGEVDEKYFDTLPMNWSVACRDSALGIFVGPQTSTIPVEQSAIVQIGLLTPPHRINGTDTVNIRWNATEGCTDCLTWTPKQLAFNIENFQDCQNITFTRIKAGPKTSFYPIFNGGGFDLVPPTFYPLFVE